MIHLLYESVILRCGHRVCLLVNQLVFVMVECGVLFEVWTEFLNIQTSVGCKGLIKYNGT
jgi:hypothetical protein